MLVNTIPDEIVASILRAQVEDLERQKSDLGDLIIQKQRKAKGLLRLFGLFGIDDDIDLEKIEDEVGTYGTFDEEATLRETEPDWDKCYNVKSPDDRIELISIEPFDGSVFAVGETVDVKAELRYNLESHDEARVELWFELPENRGGGSAGFADIKVSGGSDTVIVEGSFEVPDLDDVYIEFSLEPPASAYEVYKDCWESLDREFAGNYLIEGGSRDVR